MGSEITGVEIETLCPRRKKKREKRQPEDGMHKTEITKGLHNAKFQVMITEVIQENRLTDGENYKGMTGPVSDCLVAQSYLTLCDSRDCSPQPPLSTGILQQEYWSGLPCPPPGDLLNPGIEHRSPTLQVDSLVTEPSGKSDRPRVTALE